MLKLNDVTWLYQHLPMRFTLAVERGERIAVLGPSGAGKSTLLNLIAGFLPPASGSIDIDGQPHTHTPPARRPVSMLFQENNLFNHLTIRQNIALGMHPGLKLNAEQTAHLRAIAEQMGIDAMLERLPGELSGGQRQRAALARCLVRKQPVLLLGARPRAAPGDAGAGCRRLPAAAADAINGIAQRGRCGAHRAAVDSCGRGTNRLGWRHRLAAQRQQQRLGAAGN